MCFVRCTLRIFIFSHKKLWLLHVSNVSDKESKCVREHIKFYGHLNLTWLNFSFSFTHLGNVCNSIHNNLTSSYQFSSKNPIWESYCQPPRLIPNAPINLQCKKKTLNQFFNKQRSFLINKFNKQRWTVENYREAGNR